ncbi:hypothetical protein GTP46_04575 [Duganella sp. FT135W]|uniref:PIN like domain-containing protein n=1 Tax=Duganella flavida TaxID=2692175 RepID=A0A6L8K5W9_9BURK|nr:hypothetical protein [Duganella flavida]
MRTLFHGYYRPNDDALEELWRDACFIFDTNVVLEAYALPETAREEFLSVLEKISDRIWIPYQVALEFHRRRFTKIKDTSKGIAEMRETGKTNLSRMVVGVNKLDFDKWNTGIQNLPAILSQLAAQYRHDSIAKQ